MIEYTVRSKEGFTDKIGELVWMLNRTREITLNEISSLTKKELDFLVHDEGNTIGALLSHIAAIEAVHTVISFENRDFNEEELAKWRDSLMLGDSARKTIINHDINFYINNLQKVRSKTIEGLREKGDQWLYEERKWPNGVAYNQYYLWYHVMEDEISHRGQIRLIKQKIRSLKEEQI